MICKREIDIKNVVIQIVVYIIMTTSRGLARWENDFGRCD